MATEMAMNETGNHFSSPLMRFLYDNASQVRDMYPLLAAPAGSFQPDPDGYYAWLVQHMRTSGFIRSEEMAHLQSQVNTALRTPDSSIARQFRRIASGKDPARPVPDGGEFAYWTYLIAPTVVLSASNVQVALLYSDFKSVVYSYRVAKNNHSIDPQEDFATYLASSNFLPKWSPLVTGTN